MASLDAFNSLLKEVVHSKRLSASKMSKLTDVALQSMEADTQLVSILYRTHKSLPTSAKVSSLYVFDALARAARHHVVKQGLSSEISSEKGNCATFLLKIEGVLDGLFQDMVTTGTSESKEKLKKVLDIWTKANTFPSTVLKRLTDVLKSQEKEPDKMNTVTLSDPRSSSNGPSTTPPAPVIDMQSSTPSAESMPSTLLALLTQVAATSASNGQTVSNTGTVAQQPNHLALLQHLAQTAKTGNGVAPHPIPLPLPFTSSGTPQSVAADTFGEVSHSQTQRDDHYDSGRKDSRFDRYGSPDRGKGRDDYYDDRPRGGFRGGFRGRGRGRGDGRSRWDDRDRYSRDREWSPHRNGRSRSRSPRSPRSPRGYGGRRDIKPYSPPRRPSIAMLAAKEQSSSAEVMSSSAVDPDPEKDEFGRDIRPQSPTSPESSVPTAQPPALESSTKDQISVPQQIPSVAANTDSSEALAPAQSKQTELEKFDITTADFSSPASWEALAALWQSNYGYFPSTEELMGFVVSRGMGAHVASQSGGQQGWPDSGEAQTTVEQTWSRRGGRGGGRGGYSRGGRGGGYSYGDFSGYQSGWGNTTGYEGQDSDAIVLGGGSAEDAAQQPPLPETGPRNSAGETERPKSGGPGGRMQRVGDKWIFVRDPPLVEP